MQRATNEPENDFCDVGILSQSQFSSSRPRTTARGIRCQEHSSFILSWNLICQRETKVITSQKSFPVSGSAETSDSRKYVCVRRLRDSARGLKFTTIKTNMAAGGLLRKTLFTLSLVSCLRYQLLLTSKTSILQAISKENNPFNPCAGT